MGYTFVSALGSLVRFDGALVWGQTSFMTIMLYYERLVAGSFGLAHASPVLCRLKCIIINHSLNISGINSYAEIEASFWLICINILHTSLHTWQYQSNTYP